MGAPSHEDTQSWMLEGGPKYQGKDISKCPHWQEFPLPNLQKQILQIYVGLTWMETTSPWT